MNTPDGGERCSKEATDRLSGLAESTIRVELGPRATGPFGRKLYYVYIDAGFSIDAVVIREGLARAWRRDGQHRGHLMALEQAARVTGVGAWTGATR